MRTTPASADQRPPDRLPFLLLPLLRARADRAELERAARAERSRSTLDPSTSACRDGQDEGVGPISLDDVEGAEEAEEDVLARRYGVSYLTLVRASRIYAHHAQHSSENLPRAVFRMPAQVPRDQNTKLMPVKGDVSTAGSWPQRFARQYSALLCVFCDI